MGFFYVVKILVAKPSPSNYHLLPIQCHNQIFVRSADPYITIGNYHQKRTNFTTYARIRNTFQQSSHLQIEPKLQQIGIGSLKVLFML